MKSVPQIITALVNGFKNGVGNIANAGAALLQGLWNGISNKVSWIVDKIRGMGRSVMSAIKGIFGIHSPSAKMRDEVGANLALGLGQGFIDRMKDVRRQMTEAIPKSFDTAVNYDIYGDGTGGVPAGKSVVINQNNTFTSKTLSAYEVLMQTARLNKQLGSVIA